ncbi:hypothetical protein [Clostridium luticellarii]|uniref:Uncharacterized protein n=1 Tax=Clostridium luticellarii TaxID=1691940 RepID=A0A2T0BNS2_9CLOT|nr:hypothetical protein [Clostridium luticellarii]PRR85513.1 hypothetical protein CLLU_14340 [Clostridium luticellarii]
MAWYYGTYSCGHEGRVNIIGPMKFREYKKERAFEGMCPDCWEKYKQGEHEKANKEAAEKAKEMELPKLEGTEKQVPWANTIRQKFIDSFIENEITKREFSILEFECSGFRKVVKDISDIKNIAYWCIENVTKAHEWIENQGSVMIAAYFREALKSPEERAKEEAEREEKRQLELEATVFPEKKVTEAVVKIKYTKKKIWACFEKNEDFRLLVKSLGYSWEDGVWERSIGETTGYAEDRAAELGNKLLNAGFPIRIMDEKVRNNAINGIYEQECKRWIKYKPKEDRLVIKWKGYNDNLYSVSKSIPGAYWDSGMCLKVNHYKEVEDFAKLYEFKFTTAARKAIEDHKEKMKEIETINPKEVKEEEPKNGLEEILNSSSDIIEDLKDD